MNKHQLPELNSSLPDNDLGGMLSAILICLIAFSIVIWSIK